MKSIRKIILNVCFLWLCLSFFTPYTVYGAVGKTYSLYIGGVGKVSDNSILQMKKVIKNNRLEAYNGGNYSSTYTFNNNGQISEIDNAISRAYKNCTSNDLAIFFYNGHGMTDGKTGLGLALSDSNYYYPYKRLADRLSKVKCRKIIVIIDACNAGAFYDKGVAKLSLVSRQKFILYLSSAKNEASQFNPDRSYSRYSMVLAEGLGKDGTVHADMLKKDGKVTAEELATYVNIRMKDQLLAAWQDVNPKHYSSNKNTVLYKYNPLKINSTLATLYTVKYRTLQLKTTAFGKTENVIWKSSNPSVAAVSSSGKVTAKKAGTATIYAFAYGNRVSCKIKVVKPIIKLSKLSLSLNTGKTYQMKATVTGKSKKVTWKSSNPSVATVSSSGKVRAKKSGSTVITASANGVYGKCTIKVMKESRYNISGTWEIDSDLTMKKNGISMFSLFGTGYKYGNSMKIDKNKVFSYFVGIGNGGKGTYTYKDNKVSYSVKQYEDGYISKGVMTVKRISGRLYIIQNCKDFLGVNHKLYWKKII